MSGAIAAACVAALWVVALFVLVWLAARSARRAERSASDGAMHAALTRDPEARARRRASGGLIVLHASHEERALEAHFEYGSGALVPYARAEIWFDEPLTIGFALTSGSGPGALARAKNYQELERRPAPGLRAWSAAPRVCARALEPIAPALLRLRASAERIEVSDEFVFASIQGDLAPAAVAALCEASLELARALRASGRRAARASNPAATSGGYAAVLRQMEPGAERERGPIAPDDLGTETDPPS